MVELTLPNMKNYAAVNNVTIIQKNSLIEGSLDSTGKVHVSGSVKGNINTKEHVVINDGGIVTGNITTQRAEISGKLNGDIRVTDLLVLKETALIFGDIYAKNLEILQGAQVNGMIYSGKNVDVLEKKGSEAKTNLPPQRKAG